MLCVGRPQTLRFSDLSIQAAFSKVSMMVCSGSALEGSAVSTSSWTVRRVSTAATDALLHSGSWWTANPPWRHGELSRRVAAG